MTIHALRRTAVARLGEVGTPAICIKAVLGLALSGTWCYFRPSGEELRRWLNEAEQQFFSDTKSLK